MSLWAILTTHRRSHLHQPAAPDRGPQPAQGGGVLGRRRLGQDRDTELDERRDQARVYGPGHSRDHEIGVKGAGEVVGRQEGGHGPAPGHLLGRLGPPYDGAYQRELIGYPPRQVGEKLRPPRGADDAESVRLIMGRRGKTRSHRSAQAPPCRPNSARRAGPADEYPSAWPSHQRRGHGKVVYVERVDHGHHPGRASRRLR